MLDYAFGSTHYTLSIRERTYPHSLSTSPFCCFIASSSSSSQSLSFSSFRRLSFLWCGRSTALTLCRWLDLVTHELRVVRLCVCAYAHLVGVKQKCINANRVLRQLYVRTRTHRVTLLATDVSRDPTICKVSTLLICHTTKESCVRTELHATKETSRE
jgi:hypothetical protein